MALYLATVKNRIYTFEYYGEDGDNLSNMGLMPGVVSHYNLIYDITNEKVLKSRYDERDLTPDAIDMLRWHASHITIDQLEEAAYEAWPTIR